jgi:hypothetical protein
VSGIDQGVRREGTHPIGVHLVHHADTGTLTTGIAQKCPVRSGVEMDRPQRGIEHTGETGVGRPVPEVSVGVVAAGEGLRPQSDLEAAVPAQREVAEPQRLQYRPVTPDQGGAVIRIGLGVDTTGHLQSCAPW